MDKKQKLILEVAKKCFNTQGIKYTSIDEIVKECKMSKATFYKYFSTKENLVYELLKYSNKGFLEQAQAIDDNFKITSKERLEQKLLLGLNYLMSNYFFNSQIIGDFSMINGKTIAEIKNRISYNLKHSYYNSLVDFYGEYVKESIWELIFVVDSIIFEFFLLIRNSNNKAFDKQLITDFIIRQLNINVENLKYNKAIIDKKILINEEFENKKEWDKSIETDFFRIIEKIKFNIKNIDSDSQRKLYEAICSIENEGLEKKYESLIMDAMIAYLEKVYYTKEEVFKLNNLRKKLGERIINE